MKTFSIDIETVECIAYAAGMANIRAKISLTENSAPGKDFSELHMSETTLRLIHQGLSKVVKELDEHSALSVTTYPALGNAKSKPI